MIIFAALPTFVSNLHNATLKVSELEGPEPTLLRCLLQQLEARLDVADTLIDEEESIVLQLDPSPINEEMQMTLECSSTSENKPSEKVPLSDIKLWCMITDTLDRWVFNALPILIF